MMSTSQLQSASQLQSQPSSLLAHADEILTRGYTVIKGVLTPEQVACALAALQKQFDHEIRFSPKELRNEEHQISFCLPAKDKVFRQLALVPDVLRLVRSLVGSECIVGAFNGYTTQPYGPKQELHVDLNTAKGLLASVLVIFVLDDFTRANGCTRVVPFSQHPDLPERAYLVEGDHWEEKAVYLEAPAGSIIAFDTALIHAASENQTAQLRRALHIQYCRWWVRPQWDFALSMPEHVKAGLTEEENKLFAIDTHPWQLDRLYTKAKRVRPPNFFDYYTTRLRLMLSAWHGKKPK